MSPLRNSQQDFREREEYKQVPNPHTGGMADHFWKRKVPTVKKPDPKVADISKGKATTTGTVKPTTAKKTPAGVKSPLSSTAAKKPGMVSPVKSSPAKPGSIAAQKSP